MRVAVFVGVFPVVSETFVLRQVTGLLDLGHDVRLFADWPGAGPIHGDVRRYGLADRVKYLQLPAEAAAGLSSWPPWRSVWGPGASRPVLNLRRMGSAVKALARTAKRSPSAALQVISRVEYGPDATTLAPLYRSAALAGEGDGVAIAHAHFGPVADALRFIPALWKVPLVASFHGFDFTRWPAERGHGVYERLFRRITLVTVGSEFARAQLKSLGCPPDRIRLLPAGVDVSRYGDRHPSHDNRVHILTVSRLVPGKGLAAALTAVAALRRQGHEVIYDIVGDGPMAAELRSMVTTLGLTRVVRFHGSESEEQVVERMLGADVFLFTSELEGQGLVAIEAQAAGLPVVVTAGGGLAEAVADGVTGFVVPLADSEQLVRRLAALADSPAMRRTMGSAGRRWVAERYDSKVLTRRLVSLYQEAIALGGGFRPSLAATPG